jgi:hypothetical protein
MYRKTALYLSTAEREGKSLLAATTNRADVVKQLHLLASVVDPDPVGSETLSKIRIWI